MKVQLFAACFVALTALLDFAAAASGHLTVQVAGLRGRAGNLRVSVWKDGSGFPRKPERAVARTEVAVNGPEMTVSFEGLPPRHLCGFGLSGRGCRREPGPQYPRQADRALWLLQRRPLLFHAPFLPRRRL